MTAPLVDQLLELGTDAAGALQRARGSVVSSSIEPDRLASYAPDTIAKLQGSLARASEALAQAQLAVDAIAELVGPPARPDR